MPIYEFNSDIIARLTETTFSAAGLHERKDLQRLLRENISVIASDVLVIAEEFGDWEDSKRRIDLLALDKQANLVVIELKRTDDGGHMELQAIRYASMVSTMTFDQTAEVYGKYLKSVGLQGESARDAILEFLGWDDPDEEEFAQDVRIVLASAEFSKEIASSVLWLIEHGIDIRCVRMKPYSLENRLLVDVQQIVPLPEAADYQFQLREKAQKERQARVSNADFTRFDVSYGDERLESQPKRAAIYFLVRQLAANGVSPDQIAALFTWRNNAFYSVDDVVSSPRFCEMASEKAMAGGPSFDKPRWFCDDGELMNFNGKSYAFTKMWGGKGWHRAMLALKQAYPEAQIDFTPSR